VNTGDHHRVVVALEKNAEGQG